MVNFTAGTLTVPQKFLLYTVSGLNFGTKWKILLETLLVVGSEEKEKARLLAQLRFLGCNPRNHLT